MRTNNRQIAANATTRQGLQVIVRTIDATLRHLKGLCMGLKRGGMRCANPWYALVPAAPVVRPVVAVEQLCSQRHQTWRPDRRSCSTLSSTVSAS
ncbi:MAG: hypothetical protein WD851_09830 [Pirellulales bacterium]